MSNSLLVANHSFLPHFQAGLFGGQSRGHSWFVNQSEPLAWCVCLSPAQATEAFFNHTKGQQRKLAKFESVRLMDSHYSARFEGEWA